jgi:hypothetical protein
MMGSITSAEDGSLVAKSRIEPRVLERLWISIEEHVIERRIIDMEFVWRNANNWPSRIIRRVVQTFSESETAYHIPCAAPLCDH